MPGVACLTQSSSAAGLGNPNDQVPKSQRGILPQPKKIQHGGTEGTEKKREDRPLTPHIRLFSLSLLRALRASVFKNLRGKTRNYGVVIQSNQWLGARRTTQFFDSRRASARGFFRRAKNHRPSIRGLKAGGWERPALTSGFINSTSDFSSPRREAGYQFFDSRRASPPDFFGGQRTTAPRSAA